MNTKKVKIANRIDTHKWFSIRRERELIVDHGVKMDVLNFRARWWKVETGTK